MRDWIGVQANAANRGVHLCRANTEHGVFRRPSEGQEILRLYSFCIVLIFPNFFWIFPNFFLAVYSMSARRSPTSRPSLITLVCDLSKQESGKSSIHPRPSIKSILFHLVHKITSEVKIEWFIRELLGSVCKLSDPDVPTHSLFLTLKVHKQP